MVEPTATPAAPVVPAAPAAPVATPSVIPAPAALAAAVVPPAPTPAASAPIAAPVVAPPVSLVPDPAPAAPTPAPIAPTLVPETKWYLSEGVAGQGDAPAWFKADKYKSVFDQAQAYPELEKRFGAFTGSPKDGVYQINVPTDVPVEFDTSHNLFQELNKWASESQLSQVAYDGIISMFSRYEASVSPDMGEIKKELGDNADARLSSVAQWAKSNLPDELYTAFKNAQTQSNAADTFKVFEAIIGKTRQVAMPKPGEDVIGAVPTGLEEINALQMAVYPDGDNKGRRKYEIDSEYRKMVETKRFALFAAQQPQT